MCFRCMYMYSPAMYCLLLLALLLHSAAAEPVLDPAKLSMKQDYSVYSPELAGLMMVRCTDFQIHCSPQALDR
jgi:hypothetical protein